MVNRDDLVRTLDDILQPELYKDYCPNGLQIEGKSTIEHVVTGVCANAALIDAAIAQDACAILVHHGFFWKGENPNIIGVKRQRIQRCLQHNLNLIAYHLPLDGHDTFGNNVQLATTLGLTVQGSFAAELGPGVARFGHCDRPLSAKEFAEHLALHLHHAPFYVDVNDEPIETIAWCTGSAEDLIEQAAALKVDAFLTGEVSLRTVALAKELGIHFFAAGHHATERGGVRAIGGHLAKTHNLRHTFIDIPAGV